MYSHTCTTLLVQVMMHETIMIIVPFEGVYIKACKVYIYYLKMVAILRLYTDT